MSYAQVVQKQRVSLMHAPSTTTPNIDPNDPSKVGHIVYSRVWKIGGSPNSIPSVFFDVSCRSERLVSVLNHLNQQFPNNCGARTHRERPRVLVGVYFEDSGDLESAVHTGLSFEGGVCILPAQALSHEAKITKVRLSGLPFMNTSKLLDGIKQSLSLYGRVIDCGIYRDAESGLLMGNGFAVLDRQPIPGHQAFNDLSHTVQWLTGDDCVYATWAAMALHCSRCHQQGHHVRNCPTNPRNTRACWSCGRVGHLSYDCPSKSNHVRGDVPSKKREVRNLHPVAAAQNAAHREAPTRDQSQISKEPSLDSQSKAASSEDSILNSDTTTMTQDAVDADMADLMQLENKIDLAIASFADNFRKIRRFYLLVLPWTFLWIGLIDFLCPRMVLFVPENMIKPLNAL